MAHGYRNIFGEERVQGPLFQTGNATLDAILTDWFFGTVQQGPPTATLAVTLESATLVGAGAIPVGATAAATLADAALAGTAPVAVSASGAATLADAVLAGTAPVATAGALAQTLADATVAGTGAIPVAGTSSATLAATTVSAEASVSGGPPVDGTLEAALADASLMALAISGTEDESLAQQLFAQPALVAVDEAVELFEEGCCL
jgi:hypothetical protein